MNHITENGYALCGQGHYGSWPVGDFAVPAALGPADADCAECLELYDAAARAESILDDHLAPLAYETACEDCGGLHGVGRCPSLLGTGAVVDDDPMEDDR